MAGQNIGSSNAPFVAAAVVAALLQLALAPQISILGGAFNFMVAFAAAAAVSFEPRTAVYVGFFSGLFYDLTSSAPVGLMALLLTLASYLAANAASGLTPGANAESLRIAGVFVLGVNLMNGVALLLLGSETSIFYALIVHGLVSAALDALACAPFLMALGAHVQTGVFSGRGESRKTYATPRRASARKRSDASYLGGGKHTGSSRSGGGKRGKHAAGTRYKGLK